MFFELPVLSSITTIPPNAMIESCSPVRPSVRLGMGLLGVFAWIWLEAATAAAVTAACFRNSRRLMVKLLGVD